MEKEHYCKRILTTSKYNHEGYNKIDNIKYLSHFVARAFLISIICLMVIIALLFCIYLNYQKSMNEAKEVLDEARNSLQNKSNSKLNFPLNPKGQFLQDKMSNGMQTANSKSNLNIDENNIINNCVLTISKNSLMQVNLLILMHKQEIE